MIFMIRIGIECMKCADIEEESDRRAKCPFFSSSFSSNHPGAKSLVQHGIESILSPNQQRQPLPALLSDSSMRAQTTK